MTFALTPLLASITFAGITKTRVIPSIKGPWSVQGWLSGEYSDDAATDVRAASVDVEIYTHSVGQVYGTSGISAFRWRLNEATPAPALPDAAMKIRSIATVGSNNAPTNFKNALAAAFVDQHNDMILWPGTPVTVQNWTTTGSLQSTPANMQIGDRLRYHATVADAKPWRPYGTWIYYWLQGAGGLTVFVTPICDALPEYDVSPQWNVPDGSPVMVLVEVRDRL